MTRPGPEDGPFFHGTKAVLFPGDLLEPGRRSNFGENRTAGHIYFAATLDAAVWGAELSVGEGRGHIYRVEPTGAFEDDPNLTDKKFPGNPTRSYRSTQPIRVVEEVRDWEGHPPEVLQHMLDSLAAMKERGEVVIDD
ncbi:NAD(+)--rifampin ADP-ribosyltransferase [Aeromicrobium duanguangcaii]|uniref:NAD(+)--rifampin ADP-ribosyltransferase n=1 Tax=Aeromicrobium duanguangcaii TaxID=2968086 RepID=A0ABY5KGG2_9ACTN|nr:NAD(+)--rifampin ADP-ribosyltransferase [Aeromicrobium duanguangcaii]MCD9153487.1 NAD(+)--rifampin ADP-ribosyltransferase [Aeromicrobium duanguangcaii]UUI69425.1 NAD(+)--rifampin ADP-ribosyltransferase [Aeromicrobium duanguangcaii]